MQALEQAYFVYVAKKWLRFAGVLKEVAAPRLQFADEIDEFARWMTEEKGGAALTVRSHRSKIAQFLKWFAERRRSLAAVRLGDVDKFLVFKGTSGWSRKSARGYADALRVFFRYAEQRKWCKPGIADGILSPTLYVHEGLPEGPRWKDVQRLLEDVKGNSGAVLRARAVLLLLTVYGLRSGEISRLLLSDFDWRQETFTVNHSKRGGAQKYPLQREVGEAILEYVRKARPRTSCRNLFLTLASSVPRHRIHQPLAHHEHKNRCGRHPMPPPRTAQPTPRVCHSFAGARSIAEGDRGSAGSP